MSAVDARIAALERRVAVQEQQIRQLLAMVSPAPSVQADEEPDALTVLRLKQAARDMVADIYKNLPNRRTVPNRKKASKAA